MLGVHPLMGHNGGPSLNVADVFSTDLYNGSTSQISITNGLDMAGSGGLAWLKNREFNASHVLQDTLRGTAATAQLATNSAGAQTGLSSAGNRISSFNSNGISITGDVSATAGDPVNNGSGFGHVAWSFRRATRFFDVVTFTAGANNNRRVAHNLGVIPGLILVKQTSQVSSWWTYHRSLGRYQHLALNTTDGVSQTPNAWGTDDHTPTDFGINELTFLNNGASVVAYLFAHDTASDSIIKCGNYVGNGLGAGPTVNVGWTPQWLLVKRSDGLNNWLVYDSQRNTTNPRNKVIIPNSNTVDTASTFNIDFTSTGFQLVTGAEPVNGSGLNYIYMAIRAEGA